MNLCNEIEVLRLVLLAKIGIDIISILIPIILLIMTTSDLIKYMMKPNNFGDVFKTISRRFATALTIFFVPTLITTVINLTSETNVDYGKVFCYNEATKENIQKLEEALEAEMAKNKAEVIKIPASSLVIPNQGEVIENGSGVTSSEIPKSSRMTPFVNGVQKPLDTGECMSYADNCACPSIGKFSGFYFTMAEETGRKMSSVKRTGDETMIQVKVQCSDGSYISKTVNSKTKTNFEQAFQKLCQLKTTGINGVKIASSNLRVDGTLNERTTSNRKTCSPHAYAIAIDINYDLDIVVNGTTYRPYSGQGTKTKQTYTQFVEAIGGENNIRNVNYMLWIHVFKPSGFTWGGNWSDGSFDPMHFEVAL